MRGEIRRSLKLSGGPRRERSMGWGQESADQNSALVPRQLGEVAELTRDRELLLRELGV